LVAAVPLPAAGLAAAVTLAAPLAVVAFFAGAAAPPAGQAASKLAQRTPALNLDEARRAE
jgi:hypothetical protein